MMKPTNYVIVSEEFSKIYVENTPLMSNILQSINCTLPPPHLVYRLMHLFYHLFYQNLWDEITFNIMTLLPRGYNSLNPMNDENVD